MRSSVGHFFALPFGFGAAFAFAFSAPFAFTPPFAFDFGDACDFAFAFAFGLAFALAFGAECFLGCSLETLELLPFGAFFRILIGGGSSSSLSPATWFTLGFLELS